jgi:RNA 3'-terminal phosphate cyclase (ATP)
LLFAKGESHVTIQGGTHVPWSPPATFIKQVFLPVLGKFGCQTFFKLRRWGWYPEGGGEIYCRIKSLNKLTPYQLDERGELMKVYGLSAVTNISNNVMERQAKSTIKHLRELKIKGDVKTREVGAAGRGTIVSLTAEFNRIRAGFSTLGEKGLSAEKVGERTVQELHNFLGKSVCLDHHLADQLLPYVALCNERVNMNVSKVTSHLLTNLWVTQKFLPINYELRGPLNLPGTLMIEPAANPEPEPVPETESAS